MKSAEIREAFLQFFAKNGHKTVDSSSLVPANDPTLLFTNAGMVQFKETFLGKETRSYQRAASSQRCVRAGGKHNDLENVGYTARHHTFFEMLGNFSFGDYFKREAIQLAWNFLTEELKLPAERLWVTVHVSDDEAADIWLKEVGVSAERFSRLDEDNFWQMGDTGPCGPSSEIFYDHGENVPGGPPGSENDDLDRYIEIWNLVFMQYEKDASGEMTPLPSPSIDTGMGLERIAAVMQGVHTNYEIDLFQNLLKAVADVTGNQDLNHTSAQVVADHIRSCSFLVADGVIPSNEGRGYVLRRIIRRAVRHGHKLGAKDTFFHRLVAALVDEMGEAYPLLVSQQAHIEKILLTEEQQFARTLEHGMAVLDEALQSIKDGVIPGKLVFKLYDTYGFPVDLTNDIARERELTLDMPGYDAAMAEQRQRAKAAGKFSADYDDDLQLDAETEFVGYDDLQGDGQIVALFRDGQPVEQLQAGDKGIVVLDQSPFYAESGGQAGDQGLLSLGSDARFIVKDTTKQQSGHLHHGVLKQGNLVLGNQLSASVDADKRAATALNHSATHLLHAALRQVLGDHVQQKGSLVDSDKLRFDFSHFEAVTSDELKTIEALVNEQIRQNSAVDTELMELEDAKTKGAMALFGEKYDDQVRVLSMGGDFSVELCGGTHASRTGDMGLVKIVAESGIAAGVRRLEAVTGQQALAWLDQGEQQLLQAAGLLKAGRDQVVDKLQQVLQNQRQLEKELQQLKDKMAASAGSELTSQAVDVAGVKVLAANVAGIDPKAMRGMVDQLRNELGQCVVMLGTANGDKVSLVAGVSADLKSKVKAGALMSWFAPQVGGKGGGRPDMAQGGGSEPDKLDAALAAVNGWVAEQL